MTRWSVVEAAADEDSQVVGEALEGICRDYWYPLYAFARRSGQSSENAKDLTQGFFAVFLEKGWIAAADREKGRLRTFLLTAFRRFMAKEWRWLQAEVRGGRVTTISLDDEGAEDRYVQARSELPAEEFYDRQWALALMAGTIANLEAEFVQAGRPGNFAILKGTLMAGRGEIDYAALADPLGLNEGAVRVAVHRFRKRFRTLFREGVERTLAEGENVEEEMGYLARVLGG